MNWMFIAFLLVLVLSVMLARKVDALDMIMTLVFIIVFFIVAGAIVPKIAINYEDMGALFSDKQIEILDISPELEKLPENIREELLGVYPHFGEKLQSYDTEELNGVVGFMLTGSLVLIMMIVVAIGKFVLYPISKAFDLITKLPIIGLVNDIISMSLGFVRGILFIWTLMIVISFFAATTIGTEMIKMIFDSEILSWLYMNNLVLKLFFL